MKRIFTIIVCITMCFSLCAGLKTTAYAEEIGNKFSEEISILEAMGVIKGYKNGTFLPDGEMTRAELAMLVVSAMGFDENNVTENISYYDVPIGYWAEKYIALAGNLDLMVGYDGIFNPEGIVDIQQVSKVMVQMLGYEQKALSKGGYPSGYMAVATELDLLSGIGNGTEFTRGKAAKMLLNTLETEALELDSISNDYSQYSKQGKSLMEITLDIVKKKGKIHSTSVASVWGDASCEDNEIVIDENLFTLPDIAYNNLLGREVYYYYKKSTEHKQELIYCYPANKGSVIYKVRSENILNDSASFGTKNFVFTDEKNRTCYENIEAAIVFINGKIPSSSITKSDLAPIDGEVTLIDDNGDNRIDLVFVSHWRTAIAATVNTNAEEILDKLGGGIIDCEEKSSRTVEIIKDGKEVLLSAIKEWDVLLVTESKDKKYLRIVATSKTVQGILSEYSSDEKTVLINGESFGINPKMTDADKKIGENFLFRVDAEGRIVYAERSEFLNGGYAFLFKAAGKSGIGKNIQLKMLTQDGEMKIFESDSKIEYNDEGKLSATEVCNKICPGGADANTLIVYSLNKDGLVNRIYTPQSNSDYLTLDYPQGTRSFSKLSNIFGLYEAEGFGVDANAPIFYIVNGAEEESKMITTDSLSDKTAYTVAGYNAGETMIPDVMVLTVQSGSSGGIKIAYDTPIGIIDKISYGINSDGEDVPLFHILSGGQELKLFGRTQEKISVKKIFYPDRTQSVIPFSELQSGDLVFYSKNYKGEVEAICKILPYTKNAKISQEPEWISEHGWSNEKVFGTVERLSGGFAEVSVNGEKYLFSLAGAVATVVDMENDEIYSGTVDEITPRSLNSTQYSKIFLSVGQGKVSTVIIYNGWD